MDSRTVRVSVIIPMFNMENYLERCLDSVKAQRFTAFEAILVDDGSTDGTREIAARYAASDPRFRLVCQPNGGVACARNTGLKEAVGEFVAFVDSDDFVEPGFLEKLYGKAAEEGADIVCCNFNRYFSKADFRLPHLLTKRPKTYPSAPLLKSLLHDVTVQSYLWNKLWRRSLFSGHQIAFPAAVFEDTQVAFRLFYHAEKIAVIPDILYNYTQRGDSIVHTLDAESENDFLDAFASIRRFLEQQGAYPQIRRHFTYFTIKSLSFVWSVVCLIHLRHRSLRGMGGNFRRSCAFLRYYGGRDFRLQGPQPEASGVVRAPGNPSPGIKSAFEP